MQKKVFFYMSSHFHNAYGHMVRNPPEGFEYVKSEFMAHEETVLTLSSVSPGLGGKIKGVLKGIQPRISPVYNDLLIKLNRPKVRRFEASGYDLIHSAQSLLATETPYVADFEHAAVFSGFNQYALERAGFVRALKKVLLSRNLKKLIPWTNSAKKSLLNFVKGDGIEEKVEVVLAPITPPEKFERKKHAGVNFLFIGKVFYEKGGYDSLLAFDRISEKYDATLTMVAPSAPEDVKAQFSKNGKIKILGPQPYEELKRIYSESDVMLFPSHYDTYGFVIPEAFSYGLPVIAADNFSTSELVDHEKTGLVVKSYYSSYKEDCGYLYPNIGELSRMRLESCKHPTDGYIDELAKAIERTINDGTLRKRMAENAKKEALEGKFSLNAWKGKIGRIYREALSN